jgi:hypothetical protein
MDRKRRDNTVGDIVVVMEKKAPAKDNKELKRRIRIPKTKKKRTGNYKGPNPLGRPELYTEKIGAFICQELCKGQPLTKICKDPKVPSIPTVFTWLNPLHPNHKPEFLKSYREAREVQGEVYAEQSVEIADDGRNDTYTRLNPRTKKVEKVVDYDHIQRSKLRVDTRLKMASHLTPTKFGENKKLQLTGKDDTPLIPQAINLVVNFVKPDKAVGKK